jgi:hypothetical protein
VTASPPTWGQPPPTNPPKPKRPWFRRWWAISLGILLALFVLAGIFGEPPPQDSAAKGPAATAPPTTETPATTEAPVTTEQVPVTTAKPKPMTYRTISARQWALIAKNPDAHDSEHIIVHGQVTQFDGATGSDQFLASVDGVVHRKEYGYVDYETNTLLYGDQSALTDLVEGDLFTARVRVAGSESYDTQIGGNTTVPKLQITSIKVTGSAK